MKVIVLGLGIMGSCTAYQLASRGHQVIGIDANEQGHSLGSSHGRTRIIRQAYFEAPDYVPLLKRSYELWEQLENESGSKLLVKCGGLFVADKQDATIVADCKRSADLHNVAYELLSGKEVNERFPCFDFPPKYFAVYEPSAGFLYADTCVKVASEQARKHGAELHYSEPAISWIATDHGVSVKTAKAEYHADALVITAGPWAPDVLEKMSLPLHVVRVYFSYFSTPQADKYAADKCPIYCVSEDGCFHYGFPYEEGGGMKIAHHGSARFSVQSATNQICTPATCDRTVHPEETESVRQKLNSYLPGAGGDHVSSSVCLYTMTPDEHFIIDTETNNKRVVYGCGFSGHGFKFGSVVGEILADLATSRATRHQIDFLSARRFATEPAI